MLGDVKCHMPQTCQSHPLLCSSAPSFPTRNSSRQDCVHSLTSRELLETYHIAHSSLHCDTLHAASTRSTCADVLKSFSLILENYNAREDVTSTILLATFLKYLFQLASISSLGKNGPQSFLYFFQAGKICDLKNFPVTSGG